MPHRRVRRRWAQAQEIQLGALQDTTGATSDVGKDEAVGVRAAVQYYNDKGGINGKPIKLFQYDYGYRIPEAITTYKRFKDFDKVVMVLGWGTRDTEASGTHDHRRQDALTLQWLFRPFMRSQEDPL